MTTLEYARTGDYNLVRQINLSVILDHLRKRAPMSRAALAEATGLNKTTVSSLVRELLDYQFIHEIGVKTARIGRPAVLLELNPGAGAMVSADIGVDYLTVICTDFAPGVIWRRHEPTRPGADQNAVLARLIALLRQAVDAGCAAHGKVLGVAVGAPGLVDQRTGALLFAPNLKWQDVPLLATLQAALSTPVFVDNEANMAALGEYYFGAAQGYDDVLYISVGVGLGGGIVRRGSLYNGATGFAGEFGHITLDPDGELCNCGNRGCWETQVSQAALFRHVQRAIVAGNGSLLTDVAGGDLNHLTVENVVAAACNGDAAALMALEEVGRRLGIGLASLVNALNPELIVFGGPLSLGGKYLLPVINDELQRRALRWSRDAARVVIARHGFDACVMGGIATIYRAVLAQPDGVARRFA